LSYRLWGFNYPWCSKCCHGNIFHYWIYSLLENLAHVLTEIGSWSGNLVLRRGKKQNDSRCQFPVMKLYSWTKILIIGFGVLYLPLASAQIRYDRMWQEIYLYLHAMTKIAKAPIMSSKYDYNEVLQTNTTMTTWLSGFLFLLLQTISFFFGGG
jgi:hypothetical protein